MRTGLTFWVEWSWIFGWLHRIQTDLLLTATHPAPFICNFWSQRSNMKRRLKLLLKHLWELGLTYFVYRNSFMDESAKTCCLPDTVYIVTVAPDQSWIVRPQTHIYWYLEVFGAELLVHPTDIKCSVLFTFNLPNIINELLEIVSGS